MPISDEQKAMKLIDRGVRLLAEKTRAVAVCIVQLEHDAKGVMICSANLSKTTVPAFLRDAAVITEEGTPETYVNLKTKEDLGRKSH